MSNLPLGVLPDVRYDMEDIRANPGDRVFLYTDGVTDCPSPDGEPFGNERLLDSLNRNAGLSTAGVKAAVLSDLRKHLGDGSPDDDVTLMVAEIR